MPGVRQVIFSRSVARMVYSSPLVIIVFSSEKEDSGWKSMADMEFMQERLPLY